MDQKLIVQTLKSACGNKSFRFQVIIQNAKLHIYINHKTDTHPGYAFLTKLIAQAIAPLPLAEYKGAWLYSRKLGEIEPNWQTYIEFPLAIEVDEMDTIGNSQTPSMDEETGFSNASEANSGGSTDLLRHSGMIHKDALNQEDVDTFAHKLVDENELTQNLYHDFELSEFSDNSSGDTGLLNDTGMIHKAALYEEEINTFADKLSGDNSLGFDIAEQVNNTPTNAEDSSNNSSQLNLAQYCFVSNQKMLTGEMTPPDKETIRLVKLFHHFSDSNKEKILPILDDYFRLAKIPNTENLSITVQKWFQQITELDDDHRYIAEIWLSRYCFASSVTLEDFKAIAATNAAIRAEKKKGYGSNHIITSASIDRENTFTSKFDTELKSDRVTISSFVQKYLLPMVWTAATVVIIFLGINTNNSLVGSQNNPSLCKSTIGSQAYCRLGVNLVGEKKIKQLAPSAFPLTASSEAEAMRGCQRYANLKSSIVDIDPLKNPVISSYGERVFPHIYVAEARQKSIKNDQPIKVGCVYTSGNGERSPLLVKADVIPVNSSTAAIETLPEKSNISFGIYTNAINLGLYTIFTTIGLAIAAKFNLGIEIKNLQTIYLVALAVAIVQSLVGVNFLAGTILPVITMIVLSFVIQDFKFNRNFGYPPIAVGICVIVATQFLLYGLFQILINSLV